MFKYWPWLLAASQTNSSSITVPWFTTLERYCLWEIPACSSHSSHTTSSGVCAPNSMSQIFRCNSASVVVKAWARASTRRLTLWNFHSGNKCLHSLALPGTTELGPYEVEWLCKPSKIQRKRELHSLQNRVEILIACKLLFHLEQHVHIVTLTRQNMRFIYGKISDPNKRVQGTRLKAKNPISFLKVREFIFLYHLIMNTLSLSAIKQNMCKWPQITIPMTLLNI